MQARFDYPIGACLIKVGLYNDQSRFTRLLVLKIFLEMAMVGVVLCWYNCGVKHILRYASKQFCLIVSGYFFGEAILPFSLLPFAGPRSTVGRAFDS